MVAVSILVLACACFRVRRCLCSSLHYLLGNASYFHKGSGSHAHVSPRPSSSTDRWARLTTHRHLGPHNTVKSVLSCPLWPHHHRMCVIATGLGSLHKLARADTDSSLATQSLGRTFGLAGSLTLDPNWPMIPSHTPLAKVCAVKSARYDPTNIRPVFLCFQLGSHEDLHH